MPVLTQIKRPVEKEMAEFEAYFSKTMRSEIPLLKIILNYIFRRKGKQMRPLLVFLTARLNGEITEATFIAATFIELLHTASLVHDDVVDDANERRGALSINALWNSKIAVLVGDYLLSKGMLISVEKNRFDMLEIVSDAVKAMSEGELLQLQKGGLDDLAGEHGLPGNRKRRRHAPRHTAKSRQSRAPQRSPDLWKQHRKSVYLESMEEA